MSLSTKWHYSASTNSNQGSNGKFRGTHYMDLRIVSKKVVVLFLAVIWHQMNCFSQHRICSFETLDLDFKLCMHGYTKAEDNINAHYLVHHILERININNLTPIVKTCHGLDNAVALKYNNLNYILLDIEWMESLKSGSQDWVHLIIIAHEIGHHLFGHTTSHKDNLDEMWKRELEADMFSGYILGLYGASEGEIKSVVSNLFSDDGPSVSTHPKKSMREDAILSGLRISNQNEMSLMLQSLTKKASFDIKNISGLVNNARGSYYSYLYAKNKSLLPSSIESYQQAIRFHDDPQLVHELGALYLSAGNLGQYETALELTFQKTNNKKYILELIGNLIQSGNENSINKIDKYNEILEGVSKSDFNEPVCLNGYLKYLMFKARMQFLANNLDLTLLNEIESLGNEFLNNTIYNINVFSEAGSKAEIENTLGLCAMMREKYDQAIHHFTNSEKYFVFLLKNDQETEFLFNNYSLSLTSIYYNIALTYVRLRDWENGLAAIRNYRFFLNNLGKEKLSELTVMKPELGHEIHYLQGRCMHGLKRYDKAIEYFSYAIAHEDKNYLYYFRALSYLGQNNNDNACDDFKVACVKGYELGCTRFQNLCKN